MKHSTPIYTRVAMRLVWGGLLLCGAGMATAVAQTTTPYVSGRPVSVGAAGGTIDTDGSNDAFSLVSGSNLLTVTNSNESRGSALEISGPGDRVGGLTVSGTHTKVVFSGPGATISGPVTIVNRTNSLHINGSNTRVDGPVANYGKLIFGQSGVATISGSISGTGQVVQKGPGVTRITGSNSYSGGTLIEQGGTIIVSNNKNLGAPDAPVILNGGTLRTVGDVKPDSGVAPDMATMTQSLPANLNSAEALNARELQSLSAAPAAPAPAPAPSWTLTVGGLVGRQITSWGREAGWHVIWKCGQDWVVPRSTRFSGDFRAAAGQVLEDLAAEGASVHGVFYQGNHTLVVTGGSP